VLNLSGAQTDKETGIKNLRVVAEKGHYLAPYAKLLLAIASLRDNDRARARTLLNELSHRYPGNPLYQEELGKIK
jgi:predicted Zn-dependent protease